MIEKAPVAILMPKVEDHERTRIRYGGLIDELGARGIDYFFASTHASYDAEEHRFIDPRDINRNQRADLTGEASIVRDLTMTLEDQPLFSDDEGPLSVHDPELNRFIARKDNLVISAPEIHPVTHVVDALDIDEAIASVDGKKIVVKPVTGHLSKGVFAGEKGAVAGQEFAKGTYLVQEFIDTSRGIPELGIEGVHNLRVLSVDSEPIGAIARVGGRSAEMLTGDIYGNVFEYDRLRPGVQRIVGTIHDIMNAQPGLGRNVIAIDIMRGMNANGEMIDVLCEVNRRPQRISSYDLRDPRNLDPEGIKWLSKKWDEEEAEMLSKLQ